MNKQYLYHITKANWWGEKITLFPRAYGDNRSFDEPNVSRICCAPTIENCLIAIPIEEFEIVNVYRTMNKVESVRPYRILDAHITQERWLTEPTDFIFIKNVDFVKEKFIEQFKEPKNNGYLLGGNCIESRKWQKKMKTILKTFLTSH